jgi:2-polyprenyl-3-methyl-5-hydroxy-6-metoxy-1,4-benzoquinol methylase
VTDSEAVEANRRHWDELADLHPETPFYRHYLDRLRAGGTSLHRLEIAEVGDVAGLTLLHLQCHIGTESVSWARRGALVTAVDYSAGAIAQAERLARECGVPVRFLQASVYALAGVLDEAFDVVFASWGVLCWLPDIAEWARVVSRHLKPGGRFYIAELHPLLWVFDDDADELQVRYSYFGGAEPDRDDSDGSYADRGAKLVHRTTFNWAFPLGHVVSSLIDAGLRIEFLHEHPRCVARVLGNQLVRDESIADERWYRFPEGRPDVPLAFSLRARKE